MVVKGRQEQAQLVQPAPTEDIALVKDQGEREQALKDWTVLQLQMSFADFDQLLGAKYAELLAYVE